MAPSVSGKKIYLSSKCKFPIRWFLNQISDDQFNIVLKRSPTKAAREPKMLSPSGNVYEGSCSVSHTMLYSFHPFNRAETYS